MFSRHKKKVKLQVFMMGKAVAHFMPAYSIFIERVKDIHRLGALQGHLGWDQETIMPSKGSEARSDILSWLAAEQHNRLINPEMGQMLNSLEQDESLNDDQQANVREIRRSYDKAVKLPSEFVAAFVKAKSGALFISNKARDNSDFVSFLRQL